MSSPVQQTDSIKPEDSALVKKLISETAGMDPVSHRIEYISERLLGRKYISHPLIGSAMDPEVLVTRMDGFDCVTFVETVLAIAHARSQADSQRKPGGRSPRHPGNHAQQVAFPTRADWRRYQAGPGENDAWQGDVATGALYVQQRSGQEIGLRGRLRGVRDLDHEFGATGRREAEILVALADQRSQTAFESIRLPQRGQDSRFLQPRWRLHERLQRGNQPGRLSHAGIAATASRYGAWAKSPGNRTRRAGSRRVDHENAEWFR